MANITLRVKLPYDRNKSGRLAIEVDGKTIRTYEALGRGESASPGQWQNPKTEFQDKGATPTGTYEGTGFEVKQNAHSYGPFALRLRAKSGDALIAKDVFDRDGLLIHGGDFGGPGYWRKAGALRQTQGCIRLSNEDMLNLQNVVASFTTNPQTMTCDLTKIAVSVETEEYDYEHGLCNAPSSTSSSSQPTADGKVGAVGGTDAVKLQGPN
jgi:hypothetical protein